jgi:glycerophosphoryl diester phosphodiesterase
VVQILAHRGASNSERENSARAFRRAAEVGANAVELDVRRSADGALIVHHNPHLADGRVIRATPQGELPPDVLTLREALEACSGMWVNVEIKNDPDEPDFDPDEEIADAVVDHLTSWGDDRRWLISSFRRETIDRCRILAPTIPTAWLTVDVDDETPRRLSVVGHLAVHPWYGNVTQDFIARCHDHGVQVNVWTCDDPQWMVRLAEWGVDGICTNVPDVALMVLSEAGLANSESDDPSGA